MGFGPMLLLALMEGLVSAAVLALAASGLSLVFGVMRVVNVAHGEFYMLGAVLAFVVGSLIPGPDWLGFAAALVIAPALVALLAAFADGTVLKRLKYEPEAVIVATIGFHYMLQQAALSFFGPDAQVVAPPFNWRIQFPWFGYSGYKLFVILVAGLVLLALYLVLSRSRAGLIMRATQTDREVAGAFGINVNRVYIATFAAGAALAALAAVLIVPTRQAHYLMGADALYMSFAVVIIGGLGSLRGTLAAALVIGISEGVISMFWEPTLARILATLLVAMVLVFRPEGLFGGKAR